MGRFRASSQNLDSENRQLSAQVAELTARNKQLQATVRQLQATVRQERSEAQALRDRLPAAERQALEASQELENARALLAVERRSKRALQAEVDGLTPQVAQLAASLAARREHTAVPRKPTEVLSRFKESLQR